MSYSQILFEPGDDGIVLVTINRPQKLNALNSETLGELEDAFGRAAAEPAVRGTILTGAGEKAFAAGADINELAAMSPLEAQELSLRGQRIFRSLELMKKPSIAAVNGFALGGGLELAMSCTLRVASANAKFGQPEVRLGIIAGYGGTQRLPRLVGRGPALEMLLTGEPVDSAEALRIGLVNRVVEPADLLDGARRLMHKILANAPAAVSLTMQAVDTGLNAGIEEGLRFEAAAFAVAASTGDRLEGMRAFLEKRKPEFTGK